MSGGGQPDRGGLGAAVARITDGLSRLISEHLALARVELRDDVRALAGSVAGIAVFVPLILVGYGFLCGALALALSPWLGRVGALVLVGGLNVIVGGLGAWRAAAKLKAQPVLETTRVEVTRTTHALASVARPARGNGVERRLGA
ncbi:MAG: phage holin family protein [Myxococcaceae bacterium]|nr:phage holin family protein [Myxococcaceae bacterium]